MFIPPKLGATINDFTIGSLIFRDVRLDPQLIAQFNISFQRELALFVPDVLHCNKTNIETYTCFHRSEFGDRIGIAAGLKYLVRGKIRQLPLDIYLGTDVFPLSLAALNNKLELVGGLHFYSIKIRATTVQATIIELSPFPIISDLVLSNSALYIKLIIDYYAYLLNNLIFLSNGRRINILQINSRRPEIADSIFANFYDRLDVEVETRLNIKKNILNPNSYIKV